MPCGQDDPSTRCSSAETAVSSTIPWHSVVCASQQSWLPADISFSGDQTGDSGQSSNPETTTIPSDDAKPDDAIFVYWTDLDFSNGGEIYISAPRRFAGSDSVTITWCD